MRKSPEPPPELADAIELTEEFRDSMGLNYGDGESELVTEVPSDEELARIPEWQAVNAMITAEEYLACFGYVPQPFTPVRHGLRGRPGSRNKQK